MPYFAYVSFCRDVRAFRKLEYIIFLSNIQSGGEEHNGKKNKGNKSWLSQTKFWNKSIENQVRSWHGFSNFIFCLFLSSIFWFLCNFYTYNFPLFPYFSVSTAPLLVSSTTPTAFPILPFLSSSQATLLQQEQTTRQIFSIQNTAVQSINVWSTILHVQTFWMWISSFR